MNADVRETPAITVYWRPSCAFCARLRRQLDRAGVGARWVDIWQDPCRRSSLPAY